MSIDKIIQRAMSAQGWDGLSTEDVEAAAQEVARAEREAMRREARIFADCFEGEAGRRCLALLRAKTIDRPPTADEMGERDPAAMGLMAARRLGAANLIFLIEAALAYARGDSKELDTNG